MTTSNVSYQSYDETACNVVSLFDVKEHLRKYPDYVVPTVQQLQCEYNNKNPHFRSGHYYCKRGEEPLLFFWGTHYSAYVPVKSYNTVYPFYVRLLHKSLL